MKPLLPILVVASLLLAPSFAASAPSILPTSPFYGMKLTFEHISLAFTFSDAARATKLMELADGRLLEMRAIYKLNSTGGIDKAQAEYSFIMGEYAKAPLADAAFSRDIASLQAFQDELDSDTSLTERDRLYFAITLSSMSLAAADAGVVPPRMSDRPTAQLSAEAALSDAEKALEEYAFFFPAKASQENQTLDSARALLRSGEYLSAASIASAETAMMDSEIAAKRT